MPELSRKQHQAPDGVRTIGVIRPAGYQQLPSGELARVLTPADADLVTKGYACTECLAKFNTYSTVCPDCGTRFDDFQIIPAGDEWRRAET